MNNPDLSKIVDDLFPEHYDPDESGHIDPNYVHGSDWVGLPPIVEPFEGLYPVEALAIVSVTLGLGALVIRNESKSFVGQTIKSVVGVTAGIIATKGALHAWRVRSHTKETASQ